MTKQIEVSDTVYFYLKNLKKGNGDSFNEVINRLIEEVNRKTKKEEISEEFRKFKHNLSSIIGKEKWDIMDIMDMLEFFLLKATDEEGMNMERQSVLSSETLETPIIRSIMKSLKDQLSQLSLNNTHGVRSEDLTIKERLTSFLKYDERAPKDWFTSSQVKQIYEEVYKDNVKLSTISTYLAGMYSEGILMRKGSIAMRQYRLASLERRKAASASPMDAVL
ncbi:MAG: antitoxin VapB family protein [archaeon]|nr:antitoxin VapB family protein [archaeon]